MPSIRSVLARWCDRPGGRALLSAASTLRTRRQTDRDVGISFCRGAWFYRLDDVYMPVSSGYMRQHGASFPTLFADLVETSRDYWFYLYKPRQGDVIVDVGAGWGTDTYVFSKAVGAHGKVLAIEAHPRTFKVLKTICEKNRLVNVILRQVAVTSGGSRVLLTDAENHLENAVKHERLIPHGKPYVSVSGESLDNLCEHAGLTHIDFLKMNIEGGEGEALSGMRNALRNTRFVCIACHDFLGRHTRQRVREFLTEDGFATFERRRDERPYVRDHIHAVRQLSGDDRQSPMTHEEPHERVPDS